MSSEYSEFAALTGRYVLAFVFLSASVPKLLAHADFKAALANYRLLPGRLVSPVATWLPRLELTAAAALFAGVALTAVGLTVAGLLLLFAGAISVNLVRGRRIDCGCSGLTARKTISWLAALRNASLAATAVGVALWPSDALALDRGGGTSVSDAIAVLIIAGTGVLANLLITEGHRFRGASLAFTQ